MTLVALGAREPNPGEPARVVQAEDGRRFAVFLVEGELRVVDAVCPHNQGPLDQGWVRDGTTIVCPWHWYRFDLVTGACATSSQYRLGTYPVLERDGAWYADVGAAIAPRSWAERLRAHARGEA